MVCRTNKNTLGRSRSELLRRHQLKESLTRVLEFYKELGFDNLPLSCGNKLQAINCKLSASFSKVGQGEIDHSPLITCHLPHDKESAFKALREEMGDCQRCKLSKDRTHIVFGEGSAHAKIMFIGEAPGREEDLQARPFIGDAGKLLTKLIEKMGFKREDVYIANIVKCRPPKNRDPQEDEMLTCSAFLNRQIEIISPEVIISLGKISAYVLLKIKIPMSKFSITKVRGKFFEYRGISIIPTFHPAYLLRNPKAKWLVWEDAQAALKRLGKIEGE